MRRRLFANCEGASGERVLCASDRDTSSVATWIG